MLESPSPLPSPVARPLHHSGYDHPDTKIKGYLPLWRHSIKGGFKSQRTPGKCNKGVILPRRGLWGLPHPIYKGKAARIFSLVSPRFPSGGLHIFVQPGKIFPSRGPPPPSGPGNARAGVGSISPPGQEHPIPVPPCLPECYRKAAGNPCNCRGFPAALFLPRLPNCYQPHFYR